MVLTFRLHLKCVGQQALLAQQERKVQQGQRGTQVLLDLLAPLALLVQHLPLLDLLDTPVLREQLEHKEALDRPVTQDQQAQLVIRVPRVRKVYKA